MSLRNILTKKDLGQLAEICACRYLQRQGLKLLQQNFISKFGEIDLIMHDHTNLVFVEVRMKNNQQFGGALMSVDAAKQKRLIQSAQYYLLKNKQSAQNACRFDVISFTPYSKESNYPCVQINNQNFQLQWLQNAFTLDDCYYSM